MLCNSPSVKNRRHSRRVRAPLLRQLLRSRHEHLHGLPPTHSSGSSSADDISSGRTSSSERSEGYQTIAREVNAIEQQRGNAVIEKEKAKARLEKAKARLEWEMARMREENARRLEEEKARMARVREENARRLEWEMARVKEETARILSLQSEYENYSTFLERLEDLLKEKRTEQRDRFAVSDAVTEPPRPAHTRTASTDSSAAAESASQLTFVSDEKEAESSA